MGPWMGVPMSPVDFKKCKCPMSTHVPCHRTFNVASRILEPTYIVSFIYILMSLGLMSHVDFKKYLCRRVEFKHQGPFWWHDLLHSSRVVSLCGIMYVHLGPGPLTEIGVLLGRPVPDLRADQCRGRSPQATRLPLT